MKFTPELLMEVLSKRQGKEKIASIKNVCVEPGVADHQSFLSQILQITVEIKLTNDEELTKKIIVKYGEKGKKTAGFEIKKEYFDVETKAYLFLENVSHWAEKNGYNIEKYWPDYLYSSIDKNVFIIMIQDLKEIGFSLMRNGRGLLDKDHIFIAIDRLARCHAITRLYIATESPDTAGWPQPGFEFIKSFHRHGLKALAKAVRKYKEKWSYIADYLQELADNCYHEYIKCFDVVKNYFPVLSLGDCWSNNLLFKYPEKGFNSPIDVRFIDFQFSYVTSFAWDLHYLIYITLIPKLRLEIEKSLLKTYHQSLTQTLKDMGGDSRLAPSYNEIVSIMDKLLLPQLLYSAVTVVEIHSADKEDYKNADVNGEGAYISEEWFLNNPEENGYIDNIEYFESKGLFKRKKTKNVIIT